MLKLGRFIVWDMLDTRSPSITTSLQERGCDVTVVTDHDTLASALKTKFIDAIIIRGDWTLFAGDSGSTQRRDLMKIPKPTACLLVALCDELSAKEQDELIKYGFDDVLHEPVHIGQLISRLSGLSRLALMRRELDNRILTLQKFVIIADPEDSRLNFVSDKLGYHSVEPNILLIDMNADDNTQSRLYSQLRSFADVHYCHDTYSAQALLFTRDIDLSVIIAPKDPDHALTFVAELRNSSRLYNHPVIMQLENDYNCDLERAFNAGLNDIVFGHLNADELESRIRALLRHELFRRQLSEECGDINETFVRDGLTGVYSHGFGMDHIQLLMKEMASARRNLTVGRCSFVNLKTINTRFGYAAGDGILRQTAQIISRCVRGEDMVARMNGSTFLVAFPESSMAQADYAMSRLRSILHHTMFTLPGSNETVAVLIEQSLLEWKPGVNLDAVIDSLMNTVALAA